MSPAPEGWEGGDHGVSPAPLEGFFEVYRGPECAYLARRLVPGVQYCSRVKAVNCEVRHGIGAAAPGDDYSAGKQVSAAPLHGLTPHACPLAR